MMLIRILNGTLHYIFNVEITFPKLRSNEFKFIEQWYQEPVEYITYKSGEIGESIKSLFYKVLWEKSTIFSGWHESNIIHFLILIKSF